MPDPSAAGPAAVPEPPADALALIEAAVRASALVWIDRGDRAAARPVWHVWHDGAAYLVSGGSEQPAPGLAASSRVNVITRSKHTQALLLGWVAQVRPVTPDSDDWAGATAALAAERLNASDAAGIVEEWKQHSTVFALVPTGELSEAPAHYDPGSRARQPVATPATTRGPLPRVLLRRARRRPKL